MIGLSLNEVLKKSFPGVTQRRLNSALKHVDQNLILAEEAARYRFELWDKKSDIASYSATTFLARDDVQAVGDGLIYIIYCDSVPVIFQPHDPYQCGLVPMTTATVSDCAQRHVEQCIQSSIAQRIVGEIGQILAI